MHILACISLVIVDSLLITENPMFQVINLFSKYIQLTKMNITPLAILGVKWPFSKGRGG